MALSGINPAEVLIGPCTIKVGPEGSEEDFGLTTESGVRFRVKKEFIDIPADQAYGFVKKSLVNVRQFISLELEQISPEAMSIVFDTESSPSGDTLDFSYGPDPTPQRIVIGGAARNGNTFTYVTNVHFLHVGDVVRSKTAPAVMPVVVEEVPQIEAGKVTFGTYSETTQGS
jgi:hypothetical protein